jgi:nucleoside-diphosphate-sugar epimerase
MGHHGTEGFDVMDPHEDQLRDDHLDRDHGTGPDTGLHVVLGASGGIGNALVHELVRRGRQVRAVNRGGDARVPAGVERMAADVERSEEARRACAGASVVHHAAQPPYGQWPERFPPMNDAVLAAAEAARAKLVFADNLYLYGPTDGPMREDTPQQPTGPKGRTRRALAAQLLAAHAQGRVRVTMGRISDYYGPGNGYSVIGALALEPAMRGKPMRWMGDLDRPHTLHYLEDAARGLAILGERDEADGRAWHVPAAPPITGRGFMELVNRGLDAPVKAGVMGPTLLRLGALFNAQARESRETLYQWTSPFVADTSAFEETFGSMVTTPHAIAIGATLAGDRAVTA